MDLQRTDTDKKSSTPCIEEQAERPAGYAGQYRKEIAGSKSILEKLIQKKVTLLSFPYDDFNEHAIEAAQSAGYLRAFSNVPT